MESWVWALIGFVAGIIVYAIINLIIAKDPAEELENLADERAAELAKAEMKTAVLQDKLLEAETARDQQRDKSEAEYQQKLAQANADYQEKLAQAEADHQQALDDAAADFEQKLATAEAAHREKLVLVEQQFSSLENAFQQQAAEVAATLAAAGLVRETTVETDAAAAGEGAEVTGDKIPAADEISADESAIEEAAAAIALAAVDGEESLLEPVPLEEDEAEQAGGALEREVGLAEEEGVELAPAEAILGQETLDSAAAEETDAGPGAADLVAAAAGGAAVAAALADDAEKDGADVEEPSGATEVAAADIVEANDDGQIAEKTAESSEVAVESDSDDVDFPAGAAAAVGLGAAEVLSAANNEEEKHPVQTEAEIDDLMAEIAGLEEADELAELDRLEQSEMFADLDDLDDLDETPEASEPPAESTADDLEKSDLEGEEAVAAEAAIDEAVIDEPEIDEVESDEAAEAALAAAVIDEVESDEAAEAALAAAEIDEVESDVAAEAALAAAEIDEVESDVAEEAALTAAVVAAQLDSAPDPTADDLPVEPEAENPELQEAELVESAWPADTSVWTGEYFNNMKLEGDPVLVREDAEIDFDWGTGSPAPEINEDGFSVRWTRTADLPPGLYRFTVTSDDGARLWVNERLVISAWYDHTEMTFRREIELRGGPVDLRLEYYENAMAALIRVSWERIG